MGLAYALVSGLTGALGALIPWLSSPRKPLVYSILLWTGILVMIAGVAVCSLAGHERDKKRASEISGVKPRNFPLGLAICVLGGVLSCFMNLGFAFGAGVTQRARELGASVANAPNALWLIVMSSGFVSIAAYCGYLLASKRSWRNYGRPRGVGNLGSVLAMALLWEATLVAYGAGATRIGRVGPSVGWAALLSITVVASNLWGAATGEWRGAGRKAGRLMLSGIATLVLAVALVGFATLKA
jgi:L-rhamnose-H+ transport protein